MKSQHDLIYVVHRDAVGVRRTLDITGPPNGIPGNHKNFASAAPVRVVVMPLELTLGASARLDRITRVARALFSELPFAVRELAHAISSRSHRLW